MNLTSLASAVTSRIGMIEANDVSFCQASLTLWHEHLWRCRFWKDSAAFYQTSLNPLAAWALGQLYLPTQNQVVLPPVFELVAAVRSGCGGLGHGGAMHPISPQIFHRADWDTFNQLGILREYKLLPAVVAAFDVAQTLYAIFYIQDQSTNLCTATVLNSDKINQTVQDFATNTGAGIIALPAPAMALMRFTKPPTINPVTIVPASALGTLTVTNGGTAAIWVTVSAPPSGGPVSPPPVQLAPGASTNFAVTGFGNVVEGPNNPPAGATALPCVSFPGVATWNGTTWSFAPPANFLLTLNPTDTTAPLSQRIYIPGDLSQAINLYVLGKLKTPRFTSLYDEPGVAGMTGILRELAYYDMLCRDERGGTPEATMTLNLAVGPKFATDGAAGGLLKLLEDQEVLQAAYNSRIQPEAGFGSLHDTWGYIGTKADPY